MSHPDDGTIQALLDGELGPAERTRLEAHLTACAPCTARLEEARGFIDEADRLVEVLTVPTRPAGTLTRPGRRVLIRTLAWAASIVMAVGVGYWGRGTIPTAGDQVAAAPASPVVGGVGEPAAPAASTPVDAPKEVARAAPAPTTGQALSNEAKTLAPAPQAAEREAQERRADAAAMKAARAPEAPGPGWQVISMEEAVRVLGGQIRLIDGLTPDRVESGPGTAVAGADPSLELVRVVYASGSVLLDQQRPTAASALRQEDAAGLVGAAARSDGVGWQERDGVRFVVTGTVSADSIRQLMQQVR